MFMCAMREYGWHVPRYRAAFHLCYDNTVSAPDYSHLKLHKLVRGPYMTVTQVIEVRVNEEY